MDQQQPLWRPSAERVERVNVTAFARRIAEQHGSELRAFPKLRAWSAANPDKFWPALWEFCGVRASRRWNEVLADGHLMPGARWFTGARLNFAENLLRFQDDRPAIIAASEGGGRRQLSFAELHDQVARLASSLRADGVGEGDRVAGLLPNLPETIVATLATTSIGAIWSSCSPDFGARGVLDRFGQIEPKVLVACDGYRYGGKPLDVRGKVAEVAAELPGLRRTVLVPFLDPGATMAGTVRWPDYLEREVGGEIDFAQLPFDHPVYILYSSGTTGVPKAIVHGAGGTLLQHLKELVLHTDLRREDRIFYFTTCGWMMWNWLVSSLAVGATVVLYEGSPFHPDGNVLFDLADEVGITVFGTSAKWIDAVKKAGLKPIETHDLSQLRAMLSTGSPLVAESFDYVYDSVKRDLQLSSISGGTDIVSCFALGCPVLPVWRGELQTRGLGLAVEVWDDGGRPVRHQTGELVCTKPFPCMPVKFWNDPDGERYRGAYFERFAGAWTHGDWAELTGEEGTEHDGVIIYGRSDAVLNPGGVRIGTAEIYRQVEQIDEIAEALCVGQQWEGDVRVVLFVRLAPEAELSDELVGRIRRRIRENASPRHVPARVIAVADIPRTMNNKIAELAVRDVIHGRPVKNTEALANPEALDLYRDLPELRR